MGNLALQNRKSGNACKQINRKTLKKKHRYNLVLELGEKTMRMMKKDGQKKEPDCGYYQGLLRFIIGSGSYTLSKDIIMEKQN